MAEGILLTGGYKQWSESPLPTQKEIEAPSAPLRFEAETTLLEKVTRVLNAATFAIAGASIATAIGTKLIGSTISALIAQALSKYPLAATVLSIAVKVIAALAITLAVRKILAVAANLVIYPAGIISRASIKKMDTMRVEMFDSLSKENYTCRRVALNKSGIDYDAFAFEHKETKGNGQWAIVAGGNGWIGEMDAAADCATKFKERGFNVLFVNGPLVGRSSGLPTSYSIGAGQEAGLQFLEKIIQGKKILLYGTSLGGGAQGEAIVSHEFKMKDHTYGVWIDRSFDTLSHLAASMVARFVQPLFFLLGIELNTIAGAKKLQKLCIFHIVTQNSQIVAKNGPLPMDKVMEDNGTDGVIPNRASCYVGIKADLLGGGILKCYGGPFIAHNGPLPKTIEELVNADIANFVAK